jgi:hypothetical protein
MAYNMQTRDNQIQLLSEDDALMIDGRPHRLASLEVSHPVFLHSVKGNARLVKGRRAIWATGAGSGNPLRFQAHAAARESAGQILVLSPSLYEQTLDDDRTLYHFRSLPHPTPFTTEKISTGDVGTPSSLGDIPTIVAVEVLPSLELSSSLTFESSVEEYYHKISLLMRLTDHASPTIIVTIPLADTPTAGVTFACEQRTEPYSRFVYVDTETRDRVETALTTDEVAELGDLISEQDYPVTITVLDPLEDDELTHMIAASKHRVDREFKEETIKILHHRRVFVIRPDPTQG